MNDDDEDCCADCAAANDDKLKIRVANYSDIVRNSHVQAEHVLVASRCRQSHLTYILHIVPSWPKFQWYY